MPRLTLNGERRDVEAGVTILDALGRAGIHVPHLCDDPRVAPIGACRLCLVEIDGKERPVAACTTHVAEGMVIRTHTPQLVQDRRTLLRLLAAKHPRDALDAGSGNAFLEEIRAHGLESALTGRADPAADVSHPYIRVDMSRCIHCYLCERICNELQGQFTWRIWNRGAETHLLPDSGTTLLESSCVSCGACADACPSGALEDKTAALARPTRWTRTTCPYCGVGCELRAGTRDGSIVQVRPEPDAPVNKGHLCVKGRYAFGFVASPERITEPMVRERGEWRAVSWEEAIRRVAEGFARIRDAHGPDAIGVLGSARATNEENYLAQKFARVVLGTNNVDSCARVCHAPSAAALSAMLGAGAATNSFDDIERAKTLFVFGANATENHPIVGARIRQAALRGARLLVADPRQIELARIADVHLQLRAGSNVPLLNAMACTIVEEGLVDEAFVAARVAELPEFLRFIAAFPPERVAAECGVDPGLIREAARAYATQKPAMCFHGLGATEHVQGTDSVVCLVNLALLTGNVGVPGSGVNPLRGQNNVQGAAHMGCEPRHLTGYADLDAARPFFEEAWDSPIPAAPGLDLMEMMDAAQTSRLKALYAIGYDVLLTNPNARETRKSLAELELLVVQDLFLTETARDLAAVFLPAASSFEKDGTFMNAERRVQRVRRAVEPLGSARADWEILCSLARAMGRHRGFQFRSAQEIWDEVRAVWKAGAGISYARLEQGGLQWPCPSGDHPGTEILHVGTFAHGRRAALRRVEVRVTGEAHSAEFPLTLVTGRKLYQFNAGTMTGRTPNTVFQSADLLEVSPEDAEHLRLVEGERVKLSSRHGEAAVAVRVDAGLRPGEVFATFHTAETFLNRVTGNGRDPVTHTPEYKVTAVRIDKLDGRGRGAHRSAGD
jgi:formate dehydrogenase major subunit